MTTEKEVAVREMVGRFIEAAIEEASSQNRAGSRGPIPDLADVDLTLGQAAVLAGRLVWVALDAAEHLTGVPGSLIWRHYLLDRARQLADQACSQ